MGFGDFSAVCKRAPLPLCSLIDSASKSSDSDSFTGVIPQCYARSINLANTLIFQVGTAFIHIAALVMVLVIIYNVRTRYTAVGRKEMMFFLWNYIAFTILSLVVDTGVSPPGSSSYAWFVAVQMAQSAVCCWSLFYAGLTALNLWNDGSFGAMSSLYITSVAYFALHFIIALLTFKGWSSASSMGPSNNTALFILTFIVNGILLLSYILIQYFICFFTLVVNWWAIGALTLSIVFFACSQALLYAFSAIICNNLNHYVDGLIFSCIASICSVMMIYKYWEIITFDDDEYTRYTEVVSGVGSKEKAQSYFN